MTPNEPSPQASTRALLGLRIAALTVIILGGIILTQVSQIRTGAGFIVIGPRIFPVVVGVGFLLLGLLLLLRVTLLADKDLIEEVTAEEASTDWSTAALTLLSLVAYASMLQPLGYTLATALFFPVEAHILGSTRLWRNIVIGLVLGLAIYLIFTHLLGVRLPAGLLSGIL